MGHPWFSLCSFPAGNFAEGKLFRCGKSVKHFPTGCEACHRDSGWSNFLEEDQRFERKRKKASHKGEAFRLSAGSGETRDSEAI
jgi:hypothetical protein